MTLYCDHITLLLIVIWVPYLYSMSLLKKNSYFMDNSGSDIADFISSKGYIPNEKDLPKASVMKSENDVTYILSKLSDEELLILLSDQPTKSIYDLNDIAKVALGSKSTLQSNDILNLEQVKSRDAINKDMGIHKNKNERFRILPEKKEPHVALFRLEQKQVDPYSQKKSSDPNYMALQKLNNLLYSRPIESRSSEDEEKKELLFDVLVAQLKTLCCKKSPKQPDTKKLTYKPLLNDFFATDNVPKSSHKYTQITASKTVSEHMFLIINDEIRSNGSDELISVDPDSLERNSSVLLLGPISSPLSDNQLKLVMTRISNELSKPEYLPLLQQLSDGTLSDNNVGIMKSLISGPDTRRYIKPHRCNHQSVLAKVYGGPKWLICTGYLNLNTPSLYDKK